MEDPKYTQLKSALNKLGPVAPGTVRTVYLRCGKETCKCCDQPQYRHGPYFLWDRTVNGKLSSKSLSPQQAKTLKTWIANRKQLQTIVKKMISRGQQLATTID